MTNYKTLKAWILAMEIVKDGYALTKMYPAETIKIINGLIKYLENKL